MKSKDKEVNKLARDNKIKKRIWKKVLVLLPRSIYINIIDTLSKYH